jgi:hypothetical protein
MAHPALLTPLPLVPQREGFGKLRARSRLASWRFLGGHGLISLMPQRRIEGGGEQVDQVSSGLSAREWREQMAILGAPLKSAEV